jgi:HEPN domain-containing protein
MRSKDWFRQAERTIGSAGNARNAGYHEDAAFLAHHAAYLALIGVMKGKNFSQSGHSLYYMMKDLTGVDSELIHRARILDTYYIPSRYPYCFEKGCPGDYFDEQISEEAINCAKAILEFAQRAMG